MKFFSKYTLPTQTTNQVKPTMHTTRSHAGAGLSDVRIIIRNHFVPLAGWLAGIFLASATTAFGATGGEANWPQWRGPLANGVAPQGNPPTTWSETENVKWKVKLPGDGCLDKNLIAPDDGSAGAVARQLDLPLHVFRLAPARGRVALRSDAVGERPAPLRPVGIAAGRVIKPTASSTCPPTFHGERP